MFKMRCGVPNAYFLDITMYKMHVSLCYYYTNWILIYKTLSGTYEGEYTYVMPELASRFLKVTHKLLKSSSSSSPHFYPSFVSPFLPSIFPSTTRFRRQFEL